MLTKELKIIKAPKAIFTQIPQGNSKYTQENRNCHRKVKAPKEIVTQGN